MKLLSVSVIVLALSSAALAFQDKSAAPAGATPDAKVIAEQLPSYPLTTCPISHEELGKMGPAMDMVHEGRLVRLCCKSCAKEFKAKPAETLKAIDEAVVKAQKASYPLKTCAVSGEELGADAVDFVSGTRLVRLCCKDCIKGFQKEPAKFMATIDAALISEQKKSYPLDTCLVSGEKIKGDGFDHLYGTRLTRFCCEKCAASFDKEPAKYLAQLDTAAKAGAPKKN